ncbi:MAG: hypothetical protein GY854_31320, partial [Deltaproteobacteria bacterium]|nr:hypothetical protein [Deltaproteobacteria bacterium]
MEEQQYDEINDYYLLLPTFFADPLESIQSKENVHHYASVVFPLYLSELYGPEIIHDIWNRTAASAGWGFLFSIDRAVDSASQAVCDTSSADTCYTASLSSALRDFAVWNYFTGPYAHQAPEGIGYSERKNYEYFSNETMARHTTYPGFVDLNLNPYRPQHNASTYIRFENLESLVKEDSLLSIYAITETAAGLIWGVAGIYQSRINPDSHVVVTDTTSGGGIFLESILGPIDARKYRTATFILT